jgi:DNA polymerase
MPRAPVPTAAALIPADASLRTIREIASGCQACHLYCKATQTVFGEGLARARMMLVGEQPGNEEDLEGRPFVGPAGRLLDASLERAGIDRTDTYVTNVVKHFKWEPRGKRRIHAKPNAVEITACLPWLEAEIRLVRPEVVVCLGATAAQALFGRAFRVTAQRGLVLPSRVAERTVATIHPSAILRAPDPEVRRAEQDRFVEDLRAAAGLIR